MTATLYAAMVVFLALASVLGASVLGIGLARVIEAALR